MTHCVALGHLLPSGSYPALDRRGHKLKDKDQHHSYTVSNNTWAGSYASTCSLLRCTPSESSALSPRSSGSPLCPEEGECLNPYMPPVLPTQQQCPQRSVGGRGHPHLSIEAIRRGALCGRSGQWGAPAALGSTMLGCSSGAGLHSEGMHSIGVQRCTA